MFSRTPKKKDDGVRRKEKSREDVDVDRSSRDQGGSGRDREKRREEKDASKIYAIPEGYMRKREKNMDSDKSYKNQRGWVRDKEKKREDMDADKKKIDGKRFVLEGKDTEEARIVVKKKSDHRKDTDLDEQDMDVGKSSNFKTIIRTKHTYMSLPKGKLEIKLRASGFVGRKKDDRRRASRSAADDSHYVSSDNEEDSDDDRRNDPRNEFGYGQGLPAARGTFEHFPSGQVDPRYGSHDGEQDFVNEQDIADGPRNEPEYSHGPSAADNAFKPSPSIQDDAGRTPLADEEDFGDNAQNQGEHGSGEDDQEPDHESVEPASEKDNAFEHAPRDKVDAHHASGDNQQNPVHKSENEDEDDQQPGFRNVGLGYFCFSTSIERLVPAFNYPTSANTSVSEQSDSCPLNKLQKRKS